MPSAQSALLNPLFEQHLGNVDSDKAHYLQQLKNLQLPVPGKGVWRHSNLIELMRSAIQSNSESDLDIDIDRVESTPLAPNLEPNIYGCLSTTSLRELQSLVLLNGALEASGCHISTLATESSTPSQITIGKKNSNNQRLAIKVVKGSSLKLQSSLSHGHRVIFCEVEENGSADIDLTFPSSAETVFHHTAIHVATGGRVNLRLASQGCKTLRNEIVVVLAGENASVELTGGWRLTERMHLDSVIQVHHLAPNTSSNQRFHGIVDDRARASFAGLIRIDQAASGSEAHLQNRNIALTPLARAISQPELEIYTDDVICSHGATTGQLDDEMLTYMRSRGIDFDRARELLVRGFLLEVVENEKAQTLLQL